LSYIVNRRIGRGGLPRSFLRSKSGGKLFFITKGPFVILETNNKSGQVPNFCSIEITFMTIAPGYCYSGDYLFIVLTVQFDGDF